MPRVLFSSHYCDTCLALGQPITILVGEEEEEEWRALDLGEGRGGGEEREGISSVPTRKGVRKGESDPPFLLQVIVRGVK